MIQKIILDFTPSLNLGPIVVDIIKKIDVPVGIEVPTPAFHTQVIF